MMKKLILAAAGLALGATTPALAATKQFSAEAMQKQAGAGMRHGKLYVGDIGTRFEFDQGAEAVVEVVLPKQGLVRLIYPSQKSYMEFSVPKGTKLPGERPDAPCEPSPELECKREGDDKFGGMVAERWTVKPRGATAPLTVWWNAERKMALRQQLPNGAGMMSMMIGEIEHEGRKVEQWQLVFTAPDGSIRGGMALYSPELGTTVMERFPDGTMRVLSDIKLEAPDAKLFEIPSGFTRIEPPKPGDGPSVARSGPGSHPGMPPTGQPSAESSPMMPRPGMPPQAGVGEPMMPPAWAGAAPGAGDAGTPSGMPMPPQHPGFAQPPFPARGFSHQQPGGQIQLPAQMQQPMVPPPGGTGPQHGGAFPGWQMSPVPGTPPGPVPSAQAPAAQAPPAQAPAAPAVAPAVTAPKGQAPAPVAAPAKPAPAQATAAPAPASTSAAKAPAVAAPAPVQPAAGAAAPSQAPQQAQTPALQPPMPPQGYPQPYPGQPPMMPQYAGPQGGQQGAFQGGFQGGHQGAYQPGWPSAGPGAMQAPQMAPAAPGPQGAAQPTMPPQAPPAQTGQMAPAPHAYPMPGFPPMMMPPQGGPPGGFGHQGGSQGGFQGGFQGGHQGGYGPGWYGYPGQVPSVAGGTQPPAGSAPPAAAPVAPRSN